LRVRRRFGPTACYKKGQHQGQGRSANHFATLAAFRGAGQTLRPPAAASADGHQPGPATSLAATCKPPVVGVRAEEQCRVLVVS
jgi:hypothetical protein